MRTLGQVLLAGLVGCSADLVCGDGTHDEDGVCVVDDSASPLWPGSMEPDGTTSEPVFVCEGDFDAYDCESFVELWSACIQAWGGNPRSYSVTDEYCELVDTGFGNWACRIDVICEADCSTEAHANLYQAWSHCGLAN